MEDASDLPGLRPNRACRACVRIKVKCVPRPGTEPAICERCYRLCKECTTPMPRKSLHKQKPEVVQRQDRVNHATHALVETQYAAFSSSEPPRNMPTAQQAPPQPIFGPRLQNYEYFPGGNTQWAGAVHDISPTIGHMLDDAGLERHFNTFRVYMAHHFPFVVFPSDISSAIVMKRQPFLFTVCVMTALHSDPGFRACIARDILVYTSDHMLLRGEKSLDLLQGLLVMTAWYGSFTRNNPQLMNLLHLARALLVDMGLAGSAQGRVASDEASSKNFEPIDSNNRTTELDVNKRRAVLGHYYVSAKLANFFRRLDPVSWSPCVDSCLHLFDNTAEHPFDQYALSLVRLRFLSEKYNDMDTGTRSGSGLPLASYISLVRSDLDDFRQKLPRELQNNQFMTLELIQTEFSLLGSSLDARLEDLAQKLEVLHLLLAKVNTYFNTFLALNLGDIPYLTFFDWLGCANAFDLLGRLCFLEVERWDLQYARNSPGFLDTTVRMKKLLENVYDYERNQSENRSMRFKTFATRLDTAASWYHSRIEHEQNNVNAVQHSESSQYVNTSDFNFTGQVDLSSLWWGGWTEDWAALDPSITHSNTSM